MASKRSASLLYPRLAAEKQATKISKKQHGGKRPNSSGRRPGSGRKKGTPNKITAHVKEWMIRIGGEMNGQAQNDAANVDLDAL